VISTRVGYTGGNTESPTYKDVCTDRTGHAEAVEVEFDPAKVRYEDLLKVFWETTTPLSSTARARTGHAVPLAIFFHTSEQQDRRAGVKESLEKARRYSKAIVLQIVRQ